jgi:hypothetical protein
MTEQHSLDLMANVYRAKPGKNTACCVSQKEAQLALPKPASRPTRGVSRKSAISG